MKKVLMLAYTDYKFDARVRREAETLAASGDFQVSVLTLREGPRARRYEIGGVKIIEVNQKKYEGECKIRYIGSYLHFILRCFLICSYWFLRRRVDIIHIHNMPDILVLSGIFARALGCKLILDIHDSMPETYLSKFSGNKCLLFNLLCLEEFLSASLSHRVICVNHVQKETVVGRGVKAEKVTVSLNVPDPRILPVNWIPSFSKKDNNIFRMIYHGTIAERLGVDLIVRALAELFPYIPNLQFHLWSKKSAALDRIIHLGETLKVSGCLHVRPGGVILEDLPKELKIMDLGIIGNRKGIATDLMLPVKLLEYVTVGIPVVAPRLRCIQYYFTDEMISFYEPDNIISMTEAIMRLYNDKKKRVHQATAAQKFLDQYGWRTHQYDLINMYKNLAKEISEV